MNPERYWVGTNYNLRSILLSFLLSTETGDLSEKISTNSALDVDASEMDHDGEPIDKPRTRGNIDAGERSSRKLHFRCSEDVYFIPFLSFLFSPNKAHPQHHP